MSIPAQRLRSLKRLESHLATMSPRAKLPLVEPPSAVERAQEQMVELRKTFAQPIQPTVYSVLLAQPILASNVSTLRLQKTNVEDATKASAVALASRWKSILLALQQEWDAQILQMESLLVRISKIVIHFSNAMPSIFSRLQE